ncbi:LamG domain-containing protein, partial [Candidatus Woesearchaeota archaeon]|nr:LamG domain-containing protein [Candidatus Woesearchaeota archaeon]
MDSKELLQKLRLTEKYTIISLILLGVFILFFFNPHLFTGFITGENLNFSDNNSLQFEISFNEIKKPYIELTNKYGYLTGHKDVTVNYEKTNAEKNAYDITLSSSPGIAELVHLGEIPEAVVEIKGLKINKAKENESLSAIKAVIDSIEETEKRKVDEKRIKRDNLITGNIAKAGEVTIVEEIRTSVFAIESYDIESAILTLPKVSAGKIDAVYRCNEFDIEKFDCVSNWDKTTIPFIDNGDTITFSVDHFSAYAAGGDNQTNQAQLTIWDDSDNITKMNNKDIVFYAEYYNATNNAIVGDGVYCNISFDDGQKAVMNFNASSQRYEYNRKFAYGGEYQFTTACVGADVGYTNLQATDNVVVEELFVLGGLAVPTHTAPILNATNINNNTNQNLTCWNQSTADAEGDSVKNIFNWYKNGSSLMILNMPFENGVNNSFTLDYSGLNNTGNTSGGMVWNSTGGYDGKGTYEFDGTNDFINLSTQTTLTGSKQFTITAWVKRNSAATHQIYWEETSSSGYSRIYLTIESNNSIRFGVRDSAADPTGTFWSFYSNATINNNAWTHVAVIFDSVADNHSIYLNGTLSKTDTTARSALGTSQTNRIRIGSSYSGSADQNYFSGTIDEIKVYNYSLTSAQVLALFQNRTDLIHSDETTIGDQYICSVTPNDGTSDGTTLNSTSLTVITAPNITIPQLNASIYYTDSDINASVNYTDAEADIGTVYFEWFKNSTAIFTHTVSSVTNNANVSAVLMNTNFSRGDIIIVQATANDGT